MYESASAQREPMSKVDTAWLRMERATNLMMITSVVMFDTQMDVDRLKRLLSERFLAFRRFRQKAVDTATGAYWEEDADFAMDWHVRVTALPGNADKRELEKLVSQMASTPLDHSRPLWQFHVVEDYLGGSALIVRIHHCYADGLALVQVTLSLTDTDNAPEKRAELNRSWLKKDQGSVAQRLLEPGRTGLKRALAIGSTIWEKGAEILRDPSIATALAHEGSEIAKELATALTLPDDPITSLKGELGVSKRVAWAEPLPLEDVKTIGKVLGCTVNDVLLACAAGALRHYLLERGEDVEGLTIHATVPVNLRPLEHAKKLGNHFGLVFLGLPIGESNPLRRLEIVAQNMRELKQSRQAIVAFGLLAVLGMGPAMLQGPALEMFSRKATAVATNVPGPSVPLYMAGSRIREMMFWVPQNGSIGLGLSIMSYNGRVYFGLIADGKRVADPDSVTQRFAQEFEKLLLLTLLEDWNDEISAAGVDALVTRYNANASALAGSTPATSKSTASKRKPASKSTPRKTVASKKSTPKPPRIG